MTDFAYDTDAAAEPAADTRVEWTQPAPPILSEAVFLRALAADLEDGAPALYSLTFQNASEVHAQLRESTAANLAAWARILGVTSVRLEQHWGSGNHADRYSAASLYAGYRLQVWGAWSDPAAAADEVSYVSYLPVAELDRAFDEPPAVIA
jgi:hypothetical protein